MKKNSLKSGFTIVELAIVLVVIGIILAMAVKGKQLVETARIKADLAQIYKFETAFSIYYAKTGVLPTDLNKPRNGNASGDLDTQVLIDMEILSRNDMYSSVAGKSWGFIVCGIMTNGTYKGMTKAEAIAQRQLLGVCAVTGDPTVYGNVPSISFPAKLICYVEDVLDDRGQLTGYGRNLFYNPGFVMKNYNDCDGETGTLVYAYKVF